MSTPTAHATTADHDDLARILRDHGWRQQPAATAAAQLAGLCRAGVVSRQQVEAVLIDVADEASADAAERGEQGRTITNREVDRITAALGW